MVRWWIAAIIAIPFIPLSIGMIAEGEIGRGITALLSTTMVVAIAAWNIKQIRNRPQWLKDAIDDLKFATRQAEEGELKLAQHFTDSALQKLINKELYYENYMV